ncbi:MAG: hypothetical protein HUU01_02000 [Saprospiraceae bacterium]|nr:hypothetical protein [Saprospiraceae bacterium]
MSDTPGGPVKKQNIAVVQAGVALLKEKQGYSQLQIVQKLEKLKFTVSEAALSKIVRNNEGGVKILKIAADGIKALVSREIGFKWEGTAYTTIPDKGWVQAIVDISDRENFSTSQPGFVFHEDGRLSIRQKVEFFSNAQEEVIEFGIVLNTFAGYFFSRNEKEFKQHVEALLKKGITFKCYLLDPDCEETKMYFSDRAKHLPDEHKSIGKIREAIEKLGKVQQQFREKGYQGNFEIYTYQNIPNNYFMTVDGDSPNGRIMVSHYIYGESRANCPVIELSPTSYPILYERYWKSLKRLAENARLLKF